MCIAWYWQLSIFIYLMGISFVTGAVVMDNYPDGVWSGIILIIFWPLVMIASLYMGYIHDFIQLVFLKTTKRHWDSTILNFVTWNKNRKEDRLFYKNHLNDKLERTGIRFDEKDDIIRR